MRISRALIMSSVVCLLLADFRRMRPSLTHSDAAMRSLFSTVLLQSITLALDPKQLRQFAQTGARHAIATSGLQTLIINSSGQWAPSAVADAKMWSWLMSACYPR